MKLFNTFFAKRYNGMLLTSMIALCMSAVVMTVDMFLAGSFIGSPAVQAVNIVTPVIQLGQFFACLSVIGTCIVYSERIGSFDKDGADKIFSLGLVMAVAVGLVYAGLVLVLKDFYLGFYELDEGLCSYCNTYLNYHIVNFMVFPIGLFMYSMVYVDGDITVSKLSMATLLGGRVGLGILLTRSLGMMGLGMSVLLCYVLYILVITIHLFKKENSLHFVWKIELKLIPGIMKYAIIDASVYLYAAGLSLFLNVVTENRFGIAAIIVVSVINFGMEFTKILDGIGSAMAPIINTYRGQRSRYGVKMVMCTSLIWTVIISGIMIAVLCIFAGKLVGLLGVTDPEFFGICVRGMRVLALSVLTNGLLYCFTSEYLCVGKIGFGFIIVSLTNFVMPLVGMLICIPKMGIMGVFWGVVLGSLMSLVLSSALVYFGFGKEKFPFLLEKEEGVIADRTFQYAFDDASINSVKSPVETFLMDCGYAKKDILGVLFLIEEIALYVRNANEGEGNRNRRTLRAECAIIAEKDITVILSDDGKLIDLSDLNRKVNGLQSYIVTEYVEKKVSYTKNLMTMGSNRCMFKMPAEIVSKYV